MIFASLVSIGLTTLSCVTGIFLILLVLIQRGRGGGLVGALGGVGGSSPFGSRAGDMFTKITIGVAAFWILLMVVQIFTYRPAREQSREAEVSPSMPLQEEQ